MSAHSLRARILPASGLLGCACLVGCNATGWLGDPTVASFYKPTPTTIPVLQRIDLIEEPRDTWRELSAVAPEDLMPADLTYRISPGDVLTLDIYGLYQQGQWWPTNRRVDQGGYYRVPEIGDVLAAGLTPQEVQDRVTDLLRDGIMTHPQVQVAVQDSTGFTYTVYGALANWGVFTLRDPDLRLLDAIAQAGGVPQTIETIYVIRSVPISDAVRPTYMQDATRDEPRRPVDPVTGPREPEDVPDIEQLIEELGIGNDPIIAPGVLQTPGEDLVDIDDLVPVRATPRPPVDVSDFDPDPPGDGGEAAYIYVPEQDAWVRVDVAGHRTRESDLDDVDDPVIREVMLERVIAVPWSRLKRGDSSYNLVVRPNDRIYVEPPPIGNVYIRGEVARPGVFELPVTGQLTLYRLITAAGDFGPIAEPSRVSLTRRVGDNLEATITLNLAAIMQRTEPDVVLKADDHISVGTSWGATPMAIIRNGFRTTYGFGFLLDRNFGNDVFGAPPTNRLTN